MEYEKTKKRNLSLGRINLQSGNFLPAVQVLSSLGRNNHLPCIAGVEYLFCGSVGTSKAFE
jgi:hypothetical protein